MKFAKLQLGAWEFSDLVFSLISVAALVLASVLFLSEWLSPSSVVAGGCAAFAASYLHQCGNSLFKGSWSARLMFFAVILVIAILAGAVATLILGK